MTRRPHTRVVWRVERRNDRDQLVTLEFDTRAKARRRRALDRARGVAGRVEKVVLRRARR